MSDNKGIGNWIKGQVPENYSGYVLLCGGNIAGVELHLISGRGTTLPLGFRYTYYLPIEIPVIPVTK